jgi:hypothetical protein
MKTNKEQAIEWANNIIAKNELIKPIKLSSFEIVSHPIEFLKIQVLRIQESCHLESKMAYRRIKKLKDAIK